jgi:hypothetical protein
MNGVAMKFISDQDRPDLAEAVKQRQAQDPFRLSPGQLLPAAVVNGVVSFFFIGAFLSSQRNTPIEYLILVPALFYGYVAAKNIVKMI